MIPAVLHSIYPIGGGEPDTHIFLFKLSLKISSSLYNGPTLEENQSIDK